jgi:OmpA family
MRGSNKQQIAETLAENSAGQRGLSKATRTAPVRETYNLDLSSRRAMAVRDALVNELQVTNKRLKAIVIGSAAPVQPSSTTAGRAYNRRVEICCLFATTDGPCYGSAHSPGLPTTLSPLLRLGEARADDQPAEVVVGTSFCNPRRPKTPRAALNALIVNGSVRNVGEGFDTVHSSHRIPVPVKMVIECHQGECPRNLSVSAQAANGRLLLSF